jgi:hypothetical protein
MGEGQTKSEEGKREERRGGQWKWHNLLKPMRRIALFKKVGKTVNP